MSVFKILFKQKNLLLLLAIMAIAAFFRFYHLAQIPPGLYPDVAINGNDALTAFKTRDFKRLGDQNRAGDFWPAHGFRTVFFN